MKWIGNRTSFVDDSKRTTIVINPENIFWQKGMMGAWFAMWMVIGFTMVWAMNTLKLTEQEKLIVVIFLVFWAYYFIRVGRALFWLFWGKEYIKIDRDGLVIKRSIKGYGKTHSYFLENIQKVRVQMPKESSLQAVWENSPWIQNGERIEFDYIGKKIRLGKKLNEKDSKLLFQLITKKIEEHLKKN
jgi:hypothetical protein